MKTQQKRRSLSKRSNGRASQSSFQSNELPTPSEIGRDQSKQMDDYLTSTIGKYKYKIRVPKKIYFNKEGKTKPVKVFRREKVTESRLELEYRKEKERQRHDSKKSGNQPLLNNSHSIKSLKRETKGRSTLNSSKTSKKSQINEQEK